MSRRDSGKTKKIAYGAVLTALCVVLLSIGSIITTLDISLAAYAGILILFITIEGGDKMAFSVYFSASVLSMIILPQKSPAFLFLFFMGWYPILKKHAERLRPLFAWAVKLSAYNTAILLLYLVTVKLLSLNYDLVEMTVVYFLIANGAFVIFDLALSMFIPFYIFRIRKRIGFKNDLF